MFLGSDRRGGGPGPRERAQQRCPIAAPVCGAWA